MYGPIIVDNIPQDVHYSTAGWHSIEYKIRDLVLKHSPANDISRLGGITNANLRVHAALEKASSENGLIELYQEIPNFVRIQFEQFLETVEIFPIDFKLETVCMKGNVPKTYNISFKSIHDILGYCYFTRRINDLDEISSSFTNTEINDFLYNIYRTLPPNKFVLYYYIEAKDSLVFNIARNLYGRDTKGSNLVYLPIYIRNRVSHDEEFACSFFHSSYSREELISERKKYIIFGWTFENKDDLMKFRLASSSHEQYHELPDHLIKK